MVGEGDIKVLVGIERWEEGEGDIKVLVGGDFNVRTGREGGNVEEEGQEWGLRQSKDRKMNREGRLLVDFAEGKGWSIFNENIRGDESGKFTFTGGKGNTVIDYVMGSVEVRERIIEMWRIKWTQIITHYK